MLSENCIRHDLYSIHNSRIEEGCARDGEGEITIIYVNACSYTHTHTHTRLHGRSVNIQNTCSKLNCSVLPGLLEFVHNFLIAPNEKSHWNVYFFPLVLLYHAASFVTVTIARWTCSLQSFFSNMYLLHSHSGYIKKYYLFGPIHMVFELKT